MSPEQSRGEDLDVRTDIFSFGAVLYEVLTGKMAFPGKTSAVVFKAILDETPAPITRLNPILPARVDEIISKALEKDRDLRYQSAADLRTDLKRLRRDSESGRIAVSYVGAGEKLASKRSRIAEVLALVVLVIIAAALTWWISQRSANPRQPPAMTITPITSHPGEVVAPKFSPDGSQIAFLWDRGEGKGFDLYLKLIGETTPLRLTTSSGAIDDGVYLINADGGTPQSLVVDSSDNSQPSFSHDGNWIYFASDRSGSYEVWKVAAGGGQPVKVTSHGGRMPLEARDGRFLYSNTASSNSGLTGIWRIPTRGGGDTLMLNQRLYPGPLGADFFWTVADAGIYFIDNSNSRPNLKLFDPSTGRATLVAVLDKPPCCCNPALAVSPDGRTLLYSQSDNLTHEIMLVENFH